MSTKHTYASDKTSTPIKLQPISLAHLPVVDPQAVTPGMATPEQIRPYLEVLTSLRQWAINSMKYVTCRNHLNAGDKRHIRQRLQQYEYHLRGLIKGYSDHTFEIQPDLVAIETNKRLIGQAKFNKLAVNFEFPRYPLPYAFFSDQAPAEQMFEVNSDENSTILYKGDILFTKQVYSFSQLKPIDLLCVVYRYDYKHPRSNTLGWFKKIVGNYLVLAYDRPRLDAKRPDWGISLFDVVRIHQVERIQRDR